MAGYQVNRSCQPRPLPGVHNRSCQLPACPFRGEPQAQQRSQSHEGTMAGAYLITTHYTLGLYPCLEILVPARHIYSRRLGVVHWCDDQHCRLPEHEHVRRHNAWFWALPNEL